MSTEKPELMKVEDYNLETLVALAETLARRQADGHLTLMRFTTGWKVALGTPDIEAQVARTELDKMPSHPTLREALVSLLMERNRFNAY